MEFSTTSSTYKRYQAGSKAYTTFFESYFWYDADSTGFCTMMRTIYFWRPLIGFLRLFGMALPVALVGTVVYLYPAQAVTGVVVWAVIIAAFMAVVKTLQALLRAWDAREVSEKDSQVGLLGQWAKAAHDKVCPLVTFTHDEESADV